MLQPAAQRMRMHCGAVVERGPRDLVLGNFL
jgi:hypothetical protein